MKTKAIFIILTISLTCGILSAQKNPGKFIISGYVTDMNHNPVPGAMILIDKVNTNVVTNSKGFYKVKTKAGASLLTIFTFTGSTVEAPINGRTSIDITLGGVQNNAQVKTGKNEPVNIGYGTADRKEINSQVNKLNKIEDRYSSFNNIYDMLRGAVPGVQVIGKNITVQGQSSGNPNSQPLFVVDGNIVPSIDDINPSEVKSVEVLKGASASIYGSRGENGVIIIHLKGSSDR